MTTDLWMLMAAVGLQWVLIMIVATRNIFVKGLPWAFGNRDGEADAKLPVWSGRMDRANRNLQENLPIFAVVVLVVHVSGSADATSALGAMIFVGARVAHAIIYAVGISVLRTLAWFVSLVGIAMIAYSLV